MGSWRQVKASIRTQTAMLSVSSLSDRKGLIHRTGQDSRWQQSSTSHILIGATHWPHRPCMHHGGLTGSAISLQ